jgi:glycosyltransferase involved in cell wall biosynthesis
VIAGEGEDLARYRGMMVNPDRFVIDNGYITEARRAELFQRAAVVVLPYIDASQSGVAALASTYGKPAVVTSVGSLPETIEHGRTGYIVPPRDESALASAILTLLQDPSLRRRLGENARRKAETEWSPHIVAMQTLAVYEAAILERQRRTVKGSIAVSDQEDPVVNAVGRPQGL